MSTVADKSLRGLLLRVVEETDPVPPLKEPLPSPSEPEPFPREPRPSLSESVLTLQVQCDGRGWEIRPSLVFMTHCSFTV